MTETLPHIAARESAPVELEEGKNYWFCMCGLSKKQPFCDGSHTGTTFEPLKFKAEKTGKAWLCQCKRSNKKPFCDGTHSKLPAES